MMASGNGERELYDIQPDPDKAENLIFIYRREAQQIHNYIDQRQAKVRQYAPPPRNPKDAAS